MKKRILSLLLAFLMVVSIFPAPAYATDSTDVTITPSETTTETASEAACPTCGTVGCTSEHLAWCPDCKVDDCGKTHVYCETCQVNDCGVDHSALQPCVTCGSTECDGAHDNWCADCKTDNCGKAHVYCETCQKNDCGADHNATEPTEAATEPVAAISEEETTDPMVGKLVKIASDASMAWPLTAISGGTTIIAGVSEYAEVMVVMAVETVNSTTYYQLKAADGYSWPENSKVQDGYWLDSTKLEVIEEKEPCEICGETDCTTEHKQCKICEEYDCKAVHFWCGVCEAYDCGLAHIYCSACGEYDCGKTHTYCGECGEFDCAEAHEDQYKPDTAPVIPSNPTLTPGADVSLVDEYGDPVTASEGLWLFEGEKVSISAWSNMGSDATYQWQVCYNNANELWVNIYGATGKGLLTSPAMFRNIIDYQGSTYLRCIVTSGEESYASASIPVVVAEAVPVEGSMMMYSAALSAADTPATMSEEGDAGTYSIIIEFKFENGDTAAQPWTASLAAGQDYVLDVECPAVVGYKPMQERVTQTITNIQGDISYTVLYEPDYVDFKVLHFQQNIGDDSYTQVATETLTALTGSPVGSGLANSYDGFDTLTYDSTIPVAADGSTVVNVYYDRHYYLISLDVNGGYDVEPIFARYGTPINTSALVPQRTGYSFTGWTPAVPSSVPAYNTSHTAQWTVADTGFVVAFWYENANDADYTFVGSVQQTATTGSKVNGESYKDVSFENRDDEHFTYEKADTNVEIAADGSSVVNVYFSRNTYLLEYYYYQCHHTHGSGCYTTSITCGYSNHSHTLDCMDNIASSSANSIQTNHLNNNYDKVNFNVGRGTNLFYYVYYNGSWYRINGYSSSVDYSANGCPGYQHSHSNSCNTTKLTCGHGTGWSCGCSNDLSNTARWYAAYSGYHKYEEYIGDIHSRYGTTAGYRLIDVYRGGVATGETPTSGGAVGTFASMLGGYTAFYRSADGGDPFYMTYWLESADGSGTRTFDGKTFVESTTFFTMMGHVSYKNDYEIGVPHGFEAYKATFGTTDNTDSATETFTDYLSTSQNSYSPYNNFYYIRKTYNLIYFNGSTQVATRTMKFEEPLTSTYNLQDLTMTSPYGSGYYFAGWYLDPDCTVPVSWGSTKMPEGGMALYAKWSPITHTVNIYQTKGGTKLNTYSITHGTAPTSVPSAPTRTGYTFVGWFYELDGEEKAYDFSMPVYRDMDLYAKWTSGTLVSGTITYIDRATGKTIAEATPISGLLGDTKTYDAKTGTALNAGYQIGYFPETPSHSVEFSATESQNDYIFYYQKMDEVAYTVRYLEKDTGSVLHEEITGTSNAGKITVTHITISGYAADAYSKDLVLSSDESLNVVTFYYTEDSVHAPVQVEHYIQNTTGTGYIHYFSEAAYNGTIGETQTASPLSLTGFTYNAAESTNGIALTAEGAVLKLYYDRNSYSYQFLFQSSNGATLRTAVSGTALYGAQVSQIAPTIPGYSLTGAGSQTVTISTDASANVRTFVYEEDTVTIRYQVGTGGGGSVSPESESVLAVTGSASGATATAAEDYVFAGWYTNFACTQKVGENADFTPAKSSDGVWVDATYYAKFAEKTVAINYVIVGADNSATLAIGTEQVSVLTGKASGTKVTPAAGYALEGWYDNEACEGEPLSANESFTPAKSGDKWVDGTTYYAKIVEKKATINYVAVGNGTVTPGTEEVDMLTGSAGGAAAAATENISTFVGWYDNEACTGTALSTEASFKPATPDSGWADTQTYYAKFENIQYTISFDTNGGEPATIDSISYAYGDTLTLPEVTNGNYIVTWTVKEAAGDWVKDAEVENGTINHYGNVTLVANWTINVVWVDWDFNIVTSTEDDFLEIDQDVAYGVAHSYDGKTPTREATPQFSYTFKEWAEEDLSSYEALLGDELNGVVVYRAVYEATINTYTITWKNEDGTTIDATEVEYGKIPTHDDPTKEATAEYTYTFAGWTPEVVGVTGDAAYAATFTETKRSYTITWLNDDDSVIDTTTVEYGDVPAHVDPAKAATAEYTYTFAGWTPEVVEVTGEATYKATYTAEKNKYTVTWKNEDGTVLETDTVEYGDTPSYDGAVPTKAPENQYTYTFRAWSPEIVPVTGDATYIAAFDPHENFYTITWVNHDGTVLETDTDVAWDTMPEYNGDAPEKAGNAQFSYTFAAWSPEVSKVNGNATYTATFTESINTYTVTWVDEEGTVLERDENVVYGAVPSYDGETPEKAATAQYTYTFDGWDKEVVAVTDDVTYTAKFSATVNKYAVTFVDEDGTTILKEATEYEYGTVAEDIEKPTNPIKEATAEHTYTFAGWTPEIAEVTANVTYKATYMEVKNQYTISGEIDHGTVTDSVTVDYGTEAKIIFTPAVGYKFYSWKVNDGSDSLITTSDETWSYEEPQLTESKHVVVTTAPIEYTITYDLRNGVLGEGITNLGIYTIETDSFTLNNPTKAGYKFLGWATTVDATTGTETVEIEKGTTGNLTFYAVWERSLVDLTITTTCADQEQSFIFTISGTPSDSSYGTITLDVVLVGTDSITIKDLPVGTYTVTEKDGWSWREETVSRQTADLTTESKEVAFAFEAVDRIYWLSDYSYKRKKGGS